MKFITLVATLLLAFTANAGLISTQNDQASYEAGDTVTVDFFVNDLNPNVDWLQFDFSFDEFQLSFIEDSWVESPEVFDFGAYAEAYLVASDTLFMNVAFLDGFADVLGTSFRLGQAQFEALESTSEVNLLPVYQYAEDIEGGFIPEEQHQVSASVPEPSTIALFSLMAGLIWMRRRKA